MDKPIAKSPASAPLRGEGTEPVRHLVITVHGIRTFGRWQERLEAMLRAEIGQTEQLTVYAYKYGYFSVFALLVPFLRWLVTSRFRRALLRIVQDAPWDRIDLVGHSFGTHIIAWGLHGIKGGPQQNIHTIILAGSMLKSDFPWDDLIETSVGRVVNDCGTRDNTLLLSQFGVLFTGMAGRVGFTGMTSSRLRNRFMAIRHSGYFVQKGSPDDTFMRTYWLPLLTTDVEIPLVDERHENALSGPVTFLANNAEPIKLTVYITPLVVAIAVVYGLYEEAEQQRQIAMSRVLALEALEADDPDLSIRLSLEALRVRDTVEARRSLLQQTSQNLGLDAFTYLCCSDDSLSAIAFTEDSEGVFTGDAKGNLLQWNLATGNSSRLSESLSGKILLIGTTDGGKGLVAVATSQASFFNLDVTPPKPEELDLPFKEISSAVLSADGGRLAVGDRQGRIAVLDRQMNKWSTSMADPKLSKAVISLAFHPSGEFLAASYDIPAVEGFEQPIVLWDTSTGLRVDPPFVGHRFEVTSLAFAPDGKHLVSGSWDNDVRLWATDTRQIIPPILVEAARGEAELWERRGPTGVAVSPDGKTLVSVMSNELAMWDIASHKVLWRLSGIINATTLALSRNGKLAGIGGESKNFVLISTDFKHWLRAACQLAPRRLTVAETRYYLGESADRHMATEDPCLEFVDN